mmetsp:Transcript_27987/g.67440  ORF Transcript_27987/g.67440 Transcript_27987/m.67440 type:complete len:209 (+) Transcript_27987:183-809(+)
MTTRGRSTRRYGRETTAATTRACGTRRQTKDGGTPRANSRNRYWTIPTCTITRQRASSIYWPCPREEEAPWPRRRRRKNRGRMIGGGGGAGVKVRLPPLVRMGKAPSRTTAMIRAQRMRTADRRHHLAIKPIPLPPPPRPLLRHQTPPHRGALLLRPHSLRYAIPSPTPSYPPSSSTLPSHWTLSTRNARWTCSSSPHSRDGGWYTRA